MGMGEPLANFARVWRAIERIIDDLGIAARHVTVSTVGVIPGIRHLAESPRQVNLAVSLHAANNALRDRLVPLNRRYPLHELLAACADYVEATHRRISFEWALIDGVNDTRRRRRRARARRATRLRAHVNLIPLNPTPGGTAHGLTGSPPARVRAFQGRLGEKAVNATVRRTRGRSIDAACGQLAAVRRDGPRVPPGAGSTASGPPDRPVRGAKADDAPTGPGTDR